MQLWKVQVLGKDGGGSGEGGEGALAKRQRRAAAQGGAAGQASRFVGVSWHKQNCKWRAGIRHGGKEQQLSYFEDEVEAARAFDAVARELRGGEGAHGGRAGPRWHRLNFPTAVEAAWAECRGLPSLLTAAELAAAQEGRTSEFARMGWHKQRRKWTAGIRHGGRRQALGYFADASSSVSGRPPTTQASLW
jgi:hypothetical protein